MAAVDQFPGALALAALKARLVEARAIAFTVVDDFDAADGKGAAAQKTTPWAVHGSQVEVVDDPLGGKAIRWTRPKAKGTANLHKDLGGVVSLADYEYASLRLRA